MTHLCCAAVRLVLKQAKRTLNDLQQPPLALLERIDIDIYFSNTGHRHIDRDLQMRRRQTTYQAIMSAQLPASILALLERCLTRFTRLDLVKKYGALFNSAYSHRTSEVVEQVSSISSAMAEMYLRQEKYERAKRAGQTAGDAPVSL